MKGSIVSKNEKGEVIIKLPGFPYTLLGFLLFLILLFLSVQLSAIPNLNISPSIVGDLASGILVFGIAFALYAGAFQAIGNRVNNLDVFKLRWIQEVLLIAGILGAILGTIFMSVGFNITYGEDQASVVGGGLATALISFLYGLLGATGFFFIEKHLSRKVAAEQFKPRTIRSGLNIRSMLGLFLYFIMLFLPIMMMGFAMGINPAGIFFTLPVACLIIATVIIIPLVYGWKIILDVISIPFWRSNHDNDLLLSLLQAARGSKRIIALIGLATVAVTPITILKGMGAAGDAVPGAIPLIKTATILLWCLFMILYLNLAEAQTVQNVYFQTGTILQEDRSFIFKYILPSLLLVFFAVCFNITWLIATSF